MVNNYLRIQLKQFTFLWCMVDSSWSFWEKKALQLSSYQDLLIVTLCWLKKNIPWTNMKLLSQQWSVSPGIVHESPSHAFSIPWSWWFICSPKIRRAAHPVASPRMASIFRPTRDVDVSLAPFRRGESYRLKMLRPTGKILKILGGILEICVFFRNPRFKS